MCGELWGLAEPRVSPPLCSPAALTAGWSGRTTTTGWCGCAGRISGGRWRSYGACRCQSFPGTPGRQAVRRWVTTWVLSDGWVSEGSPETDVPSPSDTCWVQEGLVLSAQFSTSIPSGWSFIRCLTNTGPEPELHPYLMKVYAVRFSENREQRPLKTPGKIPPWNNISGLHKELTKQSKYLKLCTMGPKEREEPWNLMGRVAEKGPHVCVPKAVWGHG